MAWIWFAWLRERERERETWNGVNKISIDEELGELYRRHLEQRVGVAIAVTCSRHLSSVKFRAPLVFAFWIICTASLQEPFLQLVHALIASISTPLCDPKINVRCRKGQLMKWPVHDIYYIALLDYDPLKLFVWTWENSVR
jgi:hypothetical protein